MIGTRVVTSVLNAALANDRRQLTRGLGQRYEVMRASIKRWPVGGPIQGPLQVLSDLILKYGIGADDVVELIASMPDKELEIVNNREMPTSRCSTCCR